MVTNILAILLSIAYALYAFVIMMNIDKTKMPILLFVWLAGIVISLFDAVCNVLYLMGNVMKFMIKLGYVFGMIQMCLGFELDMIFILGFFYW